MYDVKQDIIGERPVGIWISEDTLWIETESGKDFCYEVEGDCCSWSYFHDFIGANKILGRKITEISQIHDDLPEGPDDDIDDWKCIEVYGYRFVVEDQILGEMTAVVSFRNESNGYYGGWMEGGLTDAAKPDNLTPVFINWTLSS